LAEEVDVNLGRFQELEYEISHRHDDGRMTRMEEQRPHHDAAEHDPERAWSRHRIFRCTACEESVTVIPGEEGGPEIGR
jgi:hypothetical protein